MEQAAQLYFEYGNYIKKLRSERNEKIKNAISAQIVSSKSKSAELFL